MKGIPQTARRPAPPSTPLWAVLALTFLNSAAAGVTFSGIPFINDTVFGYRLGMNSALGVLLGVTYIIGALATGPLIRQLERTFVWCTPKVVLAGMMVLATGLNCFPVAVWFGTPPEARHGTQWAVWVFVAFYSLLCGGLWPLVESYLAGGRSAKELPRAIGVFNVVWSTALVVSLLLIAAIPAGVQAIESPHSSLTDADRKMLALAASAVLHAAALMVLIFFTARPGEHAHEEHHYPANYPALLRLHRGLMPVVYAICYCLSPFLPTMMKSIEAPAAWASVVSATWLAARPIVFLVMDRWQGWHGTRFNAVVGGSCTFAGFAMCVTAAMIGAGTLGWVLAIAGLAIFGAGVAIVYVAALYYAMKVGAAAVDEGGKHEALIGMGYTVGPLCGLGAVGASNLGWVAVGWVNPVMLGLVSVAAGAGVLVAAHRDRRGGSDGGR